MRVLCLVALFACSQALLKGTGGGGAKKVVINAIDGQVQDLKDDLQAAKVQFAKDEGRMTTEIQNSESRIKKYGIEKAAADAEVEKNTARGDELRARIANLVQQIDYHNKDADQANKVLTMETKHFKAKLTDLAETKDALKRAIDVLSNQPAYTPQAQALLQVLQKGEPVSVTRAVSEFLQQTSKQPKGEADAYQFQSGAILELMEKLLGEFAKEFNDTDMAFRENKQSMEMLIQRIKQDVEREKQDEIDSERFLAEANNFRSVGESISATRRSSIKEEQDLVANTKENLAAKTDGFNSFSEEVAFRSEKLAEGKEQVKEAMSLLQVGSVSPKDRATEFLKAKGQKDHLDILSQAAETMSSTTGADALSKIRRMVEEMIMKLEEEAIEEQRRHGGCQTELGKNKRARKNTQSAMETASADKDGLEATVERLTEEINEHNQIVTDQTHTVNQMQADRDDANYKFKRAHDKQTKSIGNMEEAAEAVKDASADIYNLIQGTVLENMNAVMKDMEAKEDSEQKEFTSGRRALESSNNENKTMADQKNMQLSEAKSNLNSASDALAGAKKLNQKANEEYEILKRNCIAASETHEDRMEKMSEEIQSLKDALVIIQGENTGF